MPPEPHVGRFICSSASCLMQKLSRQSYRGLLRYMLKRNIVGFLPVGNNCRFPMIELPRLSTTHRSSPTYSVRRETNVQDLHEGNKMVQEDSKKQSTQLSVGFSRRGPEEPGMHCPCSCEDEGCTKCVGWSWPMKQTWMRLHCTWRQKDQCEHDSRVYCQRYWQYHVSDEPDTDATLLVSSQA